MLPSYGDFSKPHAFSDAIWAFIIGMSGNIAATI